MSQDRWQQVEELFAECVELPPALRQRRLAEACAGDDGLRAEVESLLAHAGGSGFLETPAVDQLDADALPEAADEAQWVGRKVGVYRIRELLAVGGMGGVFLAERDDEQFEQRVAVKIVKPGFDSGGLLARFLQERQTLAALDHPNIAKLLDGGTTEDGRPYLVMEYIEGRPLHSWCEEERPARPERLRVFEGICAGVQHAHRNLVVHRDLKPMNVMVTPDGVPKLLDFGIAKLLEGQVDGSETLSPLQMLTPEYASPEQIRGEAVTTASDVYSLGVILYELLADQKPYEVRTRSRLDMERIVCEQPVEPPGNRSPGLPRDLDAITMMCLRKEPERRYAGVGELLEDLRRYRMQLPVVARPDSLRYRTGKFLRRNKVPVALSALAAGLLVAGVVSTLYQAEVAQQQADVARRRAVTAERVADFIVDLFENADPWQTGGEEIPVRRLLEEGADSARRDLAAEPEILGAFLATLGRVRLNLGDEQRARELLEEAEALLAELGGAADPTLVGDTAFHLGVALYRAGQYEAAEAMLRDCLAVRVREEGADALPTASAQNTLGLVLRERGDDEQARALIEAGLATRRALLDPDDPEIAISLGNLASMALREGDLGRAIELYREALAIERSAWADGHPNLATMLNNLGYVQYLTAEDDAAFAEARSHLRAGLDMRLDVLGEDHPLTAASHNNLGLAYFAEGDYAQAAEQFERALRIAEPRLAADHPLVAQFRDNLAAAKEERAAAEEAADGGESAAAGGQ